MICAAEVVVFLKKFLQEYTTSVRLLYSKLVGALTFPDSASLPETHSRQVTIEISLSEAGVSMRSHIYYIYMIEK